MKKQIAAMSLALLAMSPVSAYENEVQALAEKLAGYLSQDRTTTTVAVVEFRDLEGGTTGLGRFLADQFSVHLVNSPGFELFNRSKLARLIDEIRLSDEGLVSPESAKRLELEGVEVLVTGTVTELGNAAQLSVAALRTSTGRVVAAVTGKISLSGDLQVLAGRRIYESRNSGTENSSSTQLVLPGAEQIGPFTITIRDLKVHSRTDTSSRRGQAVGSKTTLSATFEIQNTSDRDYLVGLAHIEQGTTATDNLSHFCGHVGGLEPVKRWGYDNDRALSLSANGKNQLTILFGCEGVDINDIGDRFTVTWAIAAQDVDTEATGNYAVSFRDIVAKR